MIQKAEEIVQADVFVGRFWNCPDCGELQVSYDYREDSCDCEVCNKSFRIAGIEETKVRVDINGVGTAVEAFAIGGVLDALDSKVDSDHPHTDLAMAILDAIDDCCNSDDEMEPSDYGSFAKLADAIKTHLESKTVVAGPDDSRTSPPSA